MMSVVSISVCGVRQLVILGDIDFLSGGKYVMSVREVKRSWRVRMKLISLSSGWFFCRPWDTRDFRFLRPRTPSIQIHFLFERSVNSINWFYQLNKLVFTVSSNDTGNLAWKPLGTLQLNTQSPYTTFAAIGNHTKAQIFRRKGRGKERGSEGGRW